MTPNLTHMDAVRVFLIRELDAMGTPPAEKEPWMDAGQFYDWILDPYDSPRHYDLVMCLVSVWMLCEEAETELGLPHRTVTELREEGSHLLKWLPQIPSSVSVPNAPHQDGGNVHPLKVKS